MIRVKHELSSKDSIAVRYSLHPKGVYDRVITRTEFEELIRPIVARTMAPVKMALADAKLAPSEIEEFNRLARSSSSR